MPEYTIIYPTGVNEIKESKNNLISADEINNIVGAEYHLLFAKTVDQVLLINQINQTLKLKSSTRFKYNKIASELTCNNSSIYGIAVYCNQQDLEYAEGSKDITMNEFLKY